MSPVRTRTEMFAFATAMICWVGLVVCCGPRRRPSRGLQARNSPSTIFRMHLGERRSDPETETGTETGTGTATGTETGIARLGVDLSGGWRVLNPETMTPVWLEGSDDGLQFSRDGSYSWTRLGGGVHEMTGTYRLSEDTLTLDGLGPTPLVLGFRLLPGRRLYLVLPEGGRSIRLILARSHGAEEPP